MGNLEDAICVLKEFDNLKSPSVISSWVVSDLSGIDRNGKPKRKKSKTVEANWIFGIQKINTMELQIIQNKIYEIRGLKVILDKDLAFMYEVSTGNMNKAVKRNADRFPDDFMFQLTNEEFDLIFQNGTSRWGGTRKLPYAFTEHGVAMLAGLLNSSKAIEVNIMIVRAFVTLRQFALGYAELNQKLETFMHETNMQFSDIYQALTEMASQNEKNQKPLKPVGYLAYEK
jgi:hypothetical protein